MQLLSATIILVRLVSSLQTNSPVFAETPNAEDVRGGRSLPPLMLYLRSEHEPKDQIEMLTALEHAGVRFDEKVIVGENSQDLKEIDRCQPQGALLNAVHFAAIGRNNEALKVLIQKGLDFKAVGLCSKPIHWAAVQLNLEGLRILLDAGVPAHSDFETRDLGVLAAEKFADLSREEQALRTQTFVDIIQALVRHGYPTTKTQFLFSLIYLEAETFKKIMTDLSTMGFEFNREDRDRCLYDFAEQNLFYKKNLVILERLGARSCLSKKPKGNL